MTSTTSTHSTTVWPLAADAPHPDPTVPVELCATSPLGVMGLVCDSFRVVGAFAFGKRDRAARQNSADSVRPVGWHELTFGAASSRLPALWRREPFFAS